MAEIEEILQLNKKYNIALYGLSRETERFIAAYRDKISIVGLLDGFKEDGDIYGYPIISLDEIKSKGVRLIIVVARPGSCKAIVKRIGAFCRENSIAVYDVRGKDLLSINNVTFDFCDVLGESRQVLLDKIQLAHVVSFDLFDTIITRKVFFYTDIFELVDIKLRSMGINIPGFQSLRLYAEKKLSKEKAPKLTDIYSYVLKKSGVNLISAEKLAELEFEQDIDTMIVRKDVCKMFNTLSGVEKKLVITTDSYYTLSQIESILDRFGINKPEKILVSCEYETSKTQKLFDILYRENEGRGILHIGDDEVADILKAAEYGFDTYHICSAMNLYDSLGGLGLEDEIGSLSDRIKVGMFVSDVFNSPFWFEGDGEQFSISSCKQIGYLFCAPMIVDFILWMKRRVKEQEFEQILFCARDGYLPGQLFRKICTDVNSVYFLSSRTAAIRAGMETDMDIDYVNSMKYFGTIEETLKMRFGIDAIGIEKNEQNKVILLKSEIHRENYRKYIERLELKGDRIGIFDFVAKGTVQMYLSKLFSQRLKGFYFLQLEPENMVDKSLDIESFYSDEEKNGSAIFENYYILETILTSPHSQLEEFDENGEPVYANETRNEKDLRVIDLVQAGITDFFEEYIRIIPEEERVVNKKLDEKMLELVNRIKIKNEDFLTLKVEDPFFGRTTNITDVIG